MRSSVLPEAHSKALVGGRASCPRFDGLNVRLPLLGCVLGLLLIQAGAARAAEKPSTALAHFSGAELPGGAMDLIGAQVDGEQVNTIYASPTGARSRVQVRFVIEAVPAEPLYVHLKAREDDAHSRCPMRIELNGKVLFEGPNLYAHPDWKSRHIAIPSGTLKPGENTLVISNRAKEGSVGMPPWLQLADCVIGAEHYVIRRDLTKNFWIALPDEVRPFPEPLPEGKEPGFKWRGTKGWMWRPEQYLAEVPVLARCKMNFMMNCYTSMCDVEHFKWGDPNANRWWEDLPESKKKAYAEVVRSCRENNVTFCFSMNPNINSKRVVNDSSPESVNQLYKHYAWMQSLGVQWFNVSLDDISEGINAATQAHVVNEILRRLRAKDPAAQMIFCPTYYWGDGTLQKQKPYLEELARELDKDIYLFWTGDNVVGKITRKAADTFRGIARHRLFLWDNYPVNDARPTMHLGPVMARDADLCEVIDGYMGNAMCQQNEGNRIPMLTCADYAWNPWAYDPERSIGQAILHLTDTQSQREVLRDLVEAYPGMLVYNVPDTGFDSVLALYGKLASTPHARQAAAAYVERIEQLARRFQSTFPDTYGPEKKTLGDDIRILKDKYAATYRN